MNCTDTRSTPGGSTGTILILEVPQGSPIYKDEVLVGNFEKNPLEVQNPVCRRGLNMF